jgi:hypothetical protein
MISQDPDNCYRNLQDPRFANEVNGFCVSLIATTATAASAVPSDFANCDLKGASSACSCIVYTLTHGASATPTSIAVSTTPSSSIADPATSGSSSAAATLKDTAVMTATTSGSMSGTTLSTSSIAMTTSTVYATKIYTVTSCAPTVTDCPAKTGKLTTEIISLYTTVCPVAASPVYPPSNSTTYSTMYSTIYATKTYTITSCAPAVTNCPVGSSTTTVYPITTSTIVLPSSPAGPAGASRVTTAAPGISTKSSVGTITAQASKTTSLPLQVTAAAGRLINGMEIAMAAAGVVGAAFL